MSYFDLISHLINRILNLQLENTAGSLFSAAAREVPSIQNMFLHLPPLISIRNHPAHLRDLSSAAGAQQVIRSGLTHSAL